MQRMINLIKAPFALGWFGVILLLIVGVVTAAGIFQFYDSFDMSMDRMEAVTALESDVRTELVTMKLNEAYFVYSQIYEEDAEDYLEQMQASRSAIDDSLQELEDYGHFSDELAYDETVIEEYAAFKTLLATHQQTFQNVVQSYQAGDAATAEELYAQADSEQQELNDQLTALIQAVEQERLYYQNIFPEDVGISIFALSGGILIILLLALWGYRLLYQRTEPVLNLRNAIIAISGDRYRADLLAGLLKKGGPAGAAARALDGLATGLREKERAQKEEIESLRQALYESRRKRLRIGSAVEKQETQP